MYNYNSINPVNIHYRKYPDNEGSKIAVDKDGRSSFQKSLTTDEDGAQRRFPNGNKVAIDYTKNRVNISQVLQDFRSTIAAINSPEEVVEEVESYLNLVGKETLKADPSKEIVLSNLKNAARITDKYIQESLKKPSKVVQDWVDALFLQNVNLKADPNEVNEDFRVKIPKEKTSAYNSGTVSQNSQKTYPQKDNYSNIQQSRQISVHQGGLAPLSEDTAVFSSTNESKENGDYRYFAQNSFIETGYETAANNAENIFDSSNADFREEIFENKETSDDTDEAASYQSETISNGFYTAVTENEALAKETLLEGKTVFEEGGDIYSTLKLYDEALTLVEKSDNLDLKSAIYYERAKIFDSYDYPELALMDYHKATKSNDGNLRAQAHIKMGNIYDDYVQFDPALDQYSMAIEDSEEVNNAQGKTKALRCMASLFASIYDMENLESFTDLAIESAKETNSGRIIAKTYLEAADNYKYIGEDNKALQMYSALAQDETASDDYDSLAANYMEASALMDKKGNKQKSYALMLKSKEYQRLARLRRMSLEDA